MSKPLKTTKAQAPKAPFSFRRHILPPLLGILMTVSVLGILNAQWIMAQMQYHFTRTAEAADLEISTKSPDPQAPPHIYIPSINVDAPIVIDEQSTQESKVQLALRRGVLHYGATATPGEKGNIVLLGHSSGAIWTPGGYKFVFTMLDKLRPNDKIIVDYAGTRYIFKVMDTKVIAPTDLSVLQPTDEPQLTLITCTPVGTSKKRLVVQARQISPRADTAKPVIKQALAVPGSLPQ
jgi:sortase A